jgi:hypothetical protein
MTEKFVKQILGLPDGIPVGDHSACRVEVFRNSLETCYEVITTG